MGWLCNKKSNSSASRPSAAPMETGFCTAGTANTFHLGASCKQGQRLVGESGVRESGCTDGQRPDHVRKQASEPQPAAARPGNHSAIYSDQPRRAACRKSDAQEVRPRGPTIPPRITGPKWTGLTTGSFPNLCPYSPFSTHQRKPNMSPNQSHRVPCLQFPASASPGRQPPNRVHLKPSLFPL